MLGARRAEAAAEPAVLQGEASDVATPERGYRVVQAAVARLIMQLSAGRER
jgi:hypothetical protein